MPTSGGRLRRGRRIQCTANRHRIVLAPGRSGGRHGGGTGGQCARSLASRLVAPHVAPRATAWLRDDRRRHDRVVDRSSTHRQQLHRLLAGPRECQHLATNGRVPPRSWLRLVRRPRRVVVAVVPPAAEPRAPDCPPARSPRRRSRNRPASRALAAVYARSLPGEGHWTVAARDDHGRVQIATTILRPDPTHPTIVAAVAWLSQRTTRLHLIAGLREPGGGPGPARAEIPTALRPLTLAAFNSGLSHEGHAGRRARRGAKGEVIARRTRHGRDPHRRDDRHRSVGHRPRPARDIPRDPPEPSPHGARGDGSSMASPRMPGNGGERSRTRCRPGAPGSA